MPIVFVVIYKDGKNTDLQWQGWFTGWFTGPFAYQIKDRTLISSSLKNGLYEDFSEWKYSISAY